MLTLLNLLTKLLKFALANSTTDVAVISGLSYDEGLTVEEARVALVQKIGENIQIRRAALVQGDVVATPYTHGLKIGCCGCFNRW